MPKKLSPIGRLFERMKGTAKDLKAGKATPDDLEAMVDALEHELDENIIYVDDDGNLSGDGSGDYKQGTAPPVPQQQTAPKQKDPADDLLQKLAKFMALQAMMQGGHRGGKSTTQEMFKKLMEEYIEPPKNMPPQEQLDYAMAKKEEFERNHANRLRGLLDMAYGKLGGSLTHGMDDKYKPQEQEYRSRHGFNDSILHKALSKAERNLQRIVRSILSDNKYDRFIGRKTRGKLDTRGLHRYPTNGRIFGKNEERKGKRYTATILVDLSSSMSRNIQTAAPAALRFHKLMSEIIPTQICGYNASFYRFVDFGQRLNKKDIEDTAHKMVGIAAEHTGKACIAQVGKLSTGKPKFGMMNLPLTPEHERIIKANGENYQDRNFGTSGNTLDGVPIRVLTDQLTAMEGRHIVIVLNDGGPGNSYRPDVYTWADRFKTPYTNENLNLKKVVEDAIKRGIMFVGIGINSDAVEEYYPKKFCTVVHDDSSIEVAFEGASKQLMRYVHRG